jgi:hypothetical protein
MLIDRHHLRLAREQVGIFAKQFFGHPKTS